MKKRVNGALLLGWILCGAAGAQENPVAINPIVHKVLVVVYDTHLDHPDRPYMNPVSLNGMLVAALEQGSLEKGFRAWQTEYTNFSPNVDLQVEFAMHTTPSPLKPGQTGSGAADYNRIFDDHNVCNRVNAGQIDEVWLWADRDGGYWEATMLGPADQIFNTVSAPTVRADCQRGVHVMGFNYERYQEWLPGTGIVVLEPSIGSALHSFTHRVENTLARFLDGKTRNDAAPGDNYFEFEGQGGYPWPETPMGYRYNGNTHYPPNVSTTADAYNYYSHTQVMADYLDWTPRHVNPPTLVSCEQWGCTEQQYQIQWLQNMPGRCMSWNMTKLNGQPMPDWWQLVLKSQAVYHTAPCPPLPPSLALYKEMGQVRLEWPTPAGGASQYQIDRCTGAGCTGFVQVALLGPNFHTWTDTGVVPGTIYRYRMRASNGSWSGYSNIADAIPPGVPDMFHVVLGSGGVSLSWWPSVPAAMFYAVERCQNWGCANFSGIDLTTATSYTDTTAVPGTYYLYRVRAFNGLYSAYTPARASATAWSIRVRALCKGGTVSTQPTSATHAVWPPSPLVFVYDAYKAGTYNVLLQSNDSDNAVYLGLRSPSGEWLKPTGTPPNPAMEYGTYFNPPTPMVKWNRNNLEVGVRWYNVDFEASPKMCDLVVVDEEP